MKQRRADLDRHAVALKPGLEALVPARWVDAVGLTQFDQDVHGVSREFVWNVNHPPEPVGRHTPERIQRPPVDAAWIVLLPKKLAEDLYHFEPARPFHSVQDCASDALEGLSSILVVAIRRCIILSNPGDWEAVVGEEDGHVGARFNRRELFFDLEGHTPAQLWVTADLVGEYHRDFDSGLMDPLQHVLTAVVRGHGVRDHMEVFGHSDAIASGPHQFRNDVMRALLLLLGKGINAIGEADQDPVAIPLFQPPSNLLLLRLRLLVERRVVVHQAPAAVDLEPVELVEIGLIPTRARPLEEIMGLPWCRNQPQDLLTSRNELSRAGMGSEPGIYQIGVGVRLCGKDPVLVHQNRAALRPQGDLGNHAHRDKALREVAERIVGVLVVFRRFPVIKKDYADSRRHALLLLDHNGLDDVARHIVTGLAAGDLAQHLHALDDLAEDGVLAVQPGGLLEGDEELAAVGTWSGIGHGQQTGRVEGQLGDDLVFELIARAARPSARRVACLSHKVFDDTVEGHAVVVAVTGQEDEVVDCHRRLIVEELKLDVALRGLDRSVVGLGRVNRHLRRSVVGFGFWFFGNNCWDRCWRRATPPKEKAYAQSDHYDQSHNAHDGEGITLQKSQEPGQRPQ